MNEEQDYLLRLKGTPLRDGWILEAPIKRCPNGSGGQFSVPYVAVRDGERAFVKILDLRNATEASDSMRALQHLTTAFNFERDLLAYCKKMSRIVTALDSGELRCEPAPFGKIYYIIFELADGDIHSQMGPDGSFEPVWSFATLRQVATGIQQLHSAGVHHQDLRPSNILNYASNAGVKVADLGRSHCSRIGPWPHGLLSIPGAVPYAPPEQLYGFALQDTDRGRASADLYHLGSMVFFMFASVMLTPVILGRLAPEHRPSRFESDVPWTGTYQDVLPHLIDAFDDCLFELHGHMTVRLPRGASAQVIPQTIDLIRVLSHPDPNLRGDRRTRAQKHGNPYDLQRVISTLRRLELEASILRRLPNAAKA